MKDLVFSEFFLNKIGIKPAGAAETTIVECVGKLEEEMETRTITKKCRGRIKKSRTKGSSGTVKLALHAPRALVRTIYDMQEVAPGVYGYGTESQHKECVITAEVMDEDDNVMYKAYPVAVVTNKSSNIDDDADDVAMLELEFTVTADDSNMIVYEVLASEISEGSDLGDKWMSEFSAELLEQAKAAKMSAATTAKVAAAKKEG